MQKEQTKKLIMDIVTGAIIVGVLVGAYFVFRKKDATPVATVSASETADQVVAVGTQVASTIRDLKDLNRSVEKFAAVFSTPAFTGLQDFSATVAPEAVGRPNPFLPTDWKLRQKAKQ